MITTFKMEDLSEQIRSTFRVEDWKLVPSRFHMPVPGASCFVCHKKFEEDDEILNIKQEGGSIRLEVGTCCGNKFTTH